MELQALTKTGELNFSLETELGHSNAELIRFKQLNESYFSLLEKILNAYLHELPIAEKVQLELRSQDKNNFDLYMYNRENNMRFYIGVGRIMPPEIFVDKSPKQGMPVPYPRIYEHLNHLFCYAGFKSNQINHSLS